MADQWFELTGNDGVRLGTDSTKPLEGDHALVTLQELRFEHLYSRDELGVAHRLRNRAGVLAVQVNGQPTTLQWATDKQGGLTTETQRKLKDRVLFLGAHGSRFDLSVALVESDGKEAEALKVIVEALAGTAGLVSLFPVGGAIGGAVISLTGALLDQIRAEVGDDVELMFEGSTPPIDGQLAEGLYTLVRTTQGSDEPGVMMSFKVQRYSPSAFARGEKRTITVLLRRLAVRPPIVAGTPKAERLRRKSVYVETVFGGGGKRGTRSMKIPARNRKGMLGDFVGISDKVLYKAPFKGPVPFDLTVALVPNSLGKELKTLVAESADLTSASVVYGTNDEDTADVVEATTKAVQSARAVVLELSGRDRAMLSEDGVIYDARNGELEGHGMIPVGKYGEWTTLRIGEREHDRAVFELVVRID